MKRSILSLFILCLIPVLSFAGPPLDDRLGEFYSIGFLGNDGTYHMDYFFTIGAYESVTVRGKLVGETGNYNAEDGEDLYGGFFHSPGLEVSMEWQYPGSYQQTFDPITLTNITGTYYPFQMFIGVRYEADDYDQGYWRRDNSYFEVEIIALELGVGID